MLLCGLLNLTPHLDSVVFTYKSYNFILLRGFKSDMFLPQGKVISNLENDYTSHGSSEMYENR